ncbi:MAG: hypothetical protein L0154_22290 [Chloroflexi bacterium]|nr:hypothetical protein [Chloroflexota bacterium]
MRLTAEEVQSRRVIVLLPGVGEFGGHRGGLVEVAESVVVVAFEQTRTSGTEHSPDGTLRIVSEVAGVASARLLSK